MRLKALLLVFVFARIAVALVLILAVFFFGRNTTPSPGSQPDTQTNFMRLDEAMGTNEFARQRVVISLTSGLLIRKGDKWYLQYATGVLVGAPPAFDDGVLTMDHQRRLSLQLPKAEAVDPAGTHHQFGEDESPLPDDAVPVKVVPADGDTLNQYTG